jgi:hypothetical protein
MSTGATEITPRRPLAVGCYLTNLEVVTLVRPGESIAIGPERMALRGQRASEWYTRRPDGLFDYVRGDSDPGPTCCFGSDSHTYWPNMVFLGRRVNGEWRAEPPPPLESREPVPFDDLDVPSLYDEFRYAGHDPAQFPDWLRSITTEPDEVDRFAPCAKCSGWRYAESMTEVQGGALVCARCLSRHYSDCALCGEFSDNTRGTVMGAAVCPSCAERHYTYCGYCGGLVANDDSDHCHGDTCESPAMEFSIRNDGDAPLREDTRVRLSLPDGVLSEEGIEAIATAIYKHSFTIVDLEEARQVRMASAVARNIGEKWQTKEGNFTKRLQRTAYNDYKVKLPSDLISLIGNIARDHSGGVDYEIEVTRDLNLPPEAFAHEDSCWWGSYGSSRCLFKSNGGFGLRTFEPSDYGDTVEGRAWVMPLKKKSKYSKYLTPTFETMSPDAFVVFNGYGNLSGYRAARIMAHMAGWTYRKIDFTCEPMYINGHLGYLVAPEVIAKHYTDSGFDLVVNVHSTLFADEQKQHDTENTENTESLHSVKRESETTNV